jgi:hypothetical protein
MLLQSIKWPKYREILLLPVVVIVRLLLTNIRMTSAEYLVKTTSIFTLHLDLTVFAFWMLMNESSPDLLCSACLDEPKLHPPS